MSSPRRLSLNWVFSGLLLILTLIFFAVIAQAFYRLFDMSRQFEHVSKNAIPGILLYNRISSEADGLKLFTNKLAKASTEPALQIAEEGMQEHLETIEALLTSAHLDEFIYLQFNAMQNELAELSELVSQRMRLDMQVGSLQDKLYQDFGINHWKIDHGAQRDSLILTRWGVGQSRLFALATQLLSTTRLYELRQITQQINILLDALQGELQDTLSDELQSQALLAKQAMGELLTSKDGLVALRYEQLRVNGRTIGRANFTIRLVENFAETLKFQASQLNSKTLAQSINTTQQTYNQIWIAGISTALALCVLIIVVIILRRRVLLRLIKLNESVKQRSELGVGAIKIKGNDEITDLANAVEAYSNTIAQQTHELSMLALQDGLTGIANRRAFDDELRRQIQTTKRFEKSLSLAIIDVDHFKAYNDNYGHAQGDEILIKVAQVLKETVHRDTDFVCRYGGEEFAVILPDTHTAGALLLAQQLRENIAKENIKHEFSSVADYLTISIGLVTCQPEKDLCEEKSLIKHADVALYKAKKEGRNRFHLFTIS